MELITNRFKKNICKCGKCNSEFYVNDDDFIEDYYGEQYWECPLCKNKNHIDFDNEEKEPMFPYDYHEYSVDTGAVSIDDAEVKKWINGCVERLRKSGNDNGYSYQSSGDTFVVVFKHPEDNEYFVHVSKHGYEAYIPFKAVDYL